MPSNTVRTLGSMLSGSWSRKIAARIKAPGIIARDLKRLTGQIGRDLVRAYARFHQTRRTPGRVYSIPGRGCRMWLPIAWGETVAMRRFGVFEPETFQTLTDTVHPGSVAIEIGACYGEFTIHLSRLVGPTGRVYSFELFPPYFAIAERNVALNDLTNVRLTNCAVGRLGSQPVGVDVSATNPYGALHQISRLNYSSRDGSESRQSAVVEVDTISLNAFILREALSPDLIFMDIEGCELEVLYDVQPLLRTGPARPIVYLEMHRTFYGDAGVEWLHTLFNRSGYATRSIGGHLLCTPVEAARGAPVEPFEAERSVSVS